MSERPKDIKLIVAEVLEKARAEERAAYLEAACGDDVALRKEVESLLQLEPQMGDFLEAPALDPDLTLDGPPVSEGPGSVIGRYKLLEKIGEGGMAVVYMAEQEQPVRRKVALKIIKLGMDTKNVIARFEAERQALALMDHPNVAQIFDGGTTDTGRPYFVMELVRGVSITDYCDTNRLGPRERLELLVQVCHAVQHAHQKGIIHRDLKPSNVMVTLHDGRPVPKIIDFGIAKATNQRLTEKTLFTRYAQIIGTPEYMSPEQAQMSGLDVDTRTDIYSLGVLLYELLTGTTPFGDEELRRAGYLEMQRVIREQEPVKPSTKLSTLGGTLTDIAKCRNCTPELLRKAIRGDLDWIVMKSLEKDRTHRYETANGLAEDVRRHLEHEPILARGPGVAYRLERFLRKHRSGVLAVLALGVLAGAAAVVLTLWNQNRLRLAETEHLQAETERLQHEDILSQAREQYAKADRDAALETIKSVLQSQHVGAEAQLLHAGILVDNRRPEEAIDILKSLLGERPAIAGAAHALLARILWESESPEAQKRAEIETHRRQAEALLPETAEAYFLRAITATTIKEQLAALDKALRLDPKHYESRRLRAFTYYASRKYEKMEDDALAMTLLRPSDPLGYSLRAAAWQELGHSPEAIADFDSALALTAKEDPQYLDLAAQRLETLLRMGSYEQVVSEGQACLSQIRAKDLSLLQYHVFCALTALGDYAKATDLFRQMVGPSQELRRLFRQRCDGYVSATLRAGRSWRPAGPAPTGAAFLPLVEAEEIYQALSAKARRIEADGFNACWSPDGQKLAYSLGARGASGIAVYDLATKETELLILAGRDPKWSPDGRSIAFVRDRQFLHISELITARYQPRGDREIWVMKADGTESRRLAQGNWPSWGKDSTVVYFTGGTYGLKSIAIDGRQAEPNSIAACSPGFHSVSPKNQYLAHYNLNRVMVKDLASKDEIAQWIVPFSFWGGFGWSPTSDELCLGSNPPAAERAGLWFFRLGQKEPVKTLDGTIMNGVWSPDGTKFAFDTGRAIWMADLDPKVSASETLGPAQTPEEHAHHMVRLYTRRIKADPNDADAYSRRAECYVALGERAGAEADMKRWPTLVGGQSPAGSGSGTPRLLKQIVDFGPPVNLGPTINSRGAHAPCLSPDGLELYFHRQDPGAPRHIYVSRRATPDGEWSVPVMLGTPIDVPSSTSLAPCLSRDGRSLYFTDEENRIYVAKRTTTHDNWGSPVSLGDVVNKGGACTPCISTDELELYFFSWRPVGHGDADLWVTKRATVNDEWGTPVNLGPTINTPHYEGYPGLSPDGLLLFFASNRPVGEGRHELYVTWRATKKDLWGPPRNLGPVVNSASAESGPKVSFDGSMLYFYSARPGGYAPRNECDIWRAPIIRITDPNSHSQLNAAGTASLVANLGKGNSVRDLQPIPWTDGSTDIDDRKVSMNSWQKANAGSSQSVR